MIYILLIIIQIINLLLLISTIPYFINETLIVFGQLSGSICLEYSDNITRYNKHISYNELTQFEKILLKNDVILMMTFIPLIGPIIAILNFIYAILVYIPHCYIIYNWKKNLYLKIYE